MKKKQLLLLLTVLFSFQLVSAQTTYVNHAASGANDGSSWADAYTNLSTALESTTAGDIWVATGTYHPTSGGNGEQARFAVLNNINLYGGFAGTEASVDDRDIAANTTTLTGDVNGDDVDDNFDNFKADNVWHVVYVDSLLSAITIDGFTIEGGANYDIDGDLYTEAGGGIYSYSSIAVENCNFRQHVSGRGAAITIIGIGTNGSTLNDCLFENNMATSSGIVYFLSMANGSLNNCQFNNNNTNRGSFYPIFCNGISVDNCSFDGNRNPTGFGSALWNWQSINLTVTNSTFTDNASQNAGAIYIDQRDVEPHHPEYITFTDCVFEGNGSNLSLDGSGTGGAVYFWKASYTMIGCSFTGNVANGSGGAIYNSGSDRTYTIAECEFENNMGNFGGAISNYAENVFATIIDCDFTSNTAGTSGGGMINGFKADVTIQDCLFDANSAGWGGSIYSQNDTTKVTIESSEFANNQADNNGGAINISGKIQTMITDTEFSENAGTFGGAIAMSEGDVDGGQLELTNCIFSYNAANQGGAINISDIDSDITSCLFYTNFALDTGTGGAISINAVDSSDLVINITNSTLANNTGTLAGGIASWEGGAEANSILNLQNTIFYNPGFNNYTIEDGAPEVVSLGGNFSADETLSASLTHAKDSNGNDLNPLFSDENNDDYSLAVSSPCINAGVNENAPAFDIEGTERFGDVDLGAYEFDPTVGVKEVVVNNVGQVKITPNPAISNISLTIENDWKGKLEVSIINATGQVVQTAVFNKIQKKSNFDVDVSNLAAGSYMAKIRKDGEITTAVFMKL